VPQQQVPAGYQAPPGYQLVPVQQPNGNGAIPWSQIQQQQVPNIDTRTIPRGAVTPENFLEMAKFWRGGEGQKAALDCPQCGGVLFRRFEGRREAAPLCESCGFNGLFVQGQGAVAVNG
jgi:hypothetical protein